jgi:uncharacterized membrane protein
MLAWGLVVTLGLGMGMIMPFVGLALNISLLWHSISRLYRRALR